LAVVSSFCGVIERNRAARGPPQSKSVTIPPRLQPQHCVHPALPVQGLQQRRSHPSSSRCQLASSRPFQERQHSLPLRLARSTAVARSRSRMSQELRLSRPSLPDIHRGTTSPRPMPTVPADSMRVRAAPRPRQTKDPRRDTQQSAHFCQCEGPSWRALHAARRTVSPRAQRVSSRQAYPAQESLSVWQWSTKHRLARQTRRRAKEMRDLCR
jgi:hypothetical protein